MGTDMASFIIAEAGVNHNGSLSMALALVDAAADAGADAVKFQTFRATALASTTAPKAGYQKRSTNVAQSQLEMLLQLQLSLEDHRALASHAARRGLTFLSTPFDSESLDLLIEQFEMSTIKVSSGDITNAPFLLEIARRAKTVILSTGMCTLAEIEAALGVLAFGFTVDTSRRPSRAAFEEAYCSFAGQHALRERVMVLHCTTEYPAPYAEVNLRAMDTLRQAFGLRTGYSDHTLGIHIPVAAAARDAAIIEKHFTLDRDLPGPDHKASLVPEELRAMVAAIRDVEASLGDGVKRPTASEWENRLVARKSLVVAMDTEAGEPLALACKRPGSGVSPFEYWTRDGLLASRTYTADEALDF